MQKDIYISVDLGLSSKKHKRNMCGCVINIDGGIDGVCLIDNTETKNEQVYTINALRDLADAMEAEFKRPENTKSHIDLAH